MTLSTDLEVMRSEEGQLISDRAQFRYAVRWTDIQSCIPWANDQCLLHFVPKRLGWANVIEVTLDSHREALPAFVKMRIATVAIFKPH